MSNANRQPYRADSDEELAARVGPDSPDEDSLEEMEGRLDRLNNVYDNQSLIAGKLIEKVRESLRLGDIPTGEKAALEADEALDCMVTSMCLCRKLRGEIIQKRDEELAAIREEAGK